MARGGPAGTGEWPRKRAGVSSIPPVEADAPNVVWAIDFQFDSTIDGKAIKIASMIDEHTRCRCCTWLNGRSPPNGSWRAREVFAAAGGPPKVLRMDNGPELVSQALQQFCHGKVGCPTSRRVSVEQRLHRIVQQPATEGVPQPQPLEQPARSPRGDRRLQTRAQPSPPTFSAGLRTPAEYAAACRHTHSRGPARSAPFGGIHRRRCGRMDFGAPHWRHSRGGSL